MRKALPVNQTPSFQAPRLFRTSFLRASFLFVILLLLFPALSGRAQDNAAFVSQNVPTSMVGGQQYSVSVTMQNTGSTTWTDAANYNLGSSNPQDNTTWKTNWNNGQRVHLPLNVPPGGKGTFAFLVTAPAAAGNLSFQWRMVHDGVTWFGATSANVVITVTVPAGQPTRTQIPQGGSTALGATGNSAADSYKGSWYITGSGVSADDTNPQGYSVTCTTGGVFNVGVPAGAPVAANFMVRYTTRVGTRIVAGEPDTVGYGFSSAFDVVAARVIPPAPAATGAPYSWQASVGGVNTANGNKVISVPLVGWTQRGGMPVGVSLIWNSQGTTDGRMTHCGSKWRCSCDARLQANADGSVGVFWGDGRSYTFAYNTTTHTYTPPAGIYDTLTAPNSGQFILKTKGQIAYTFNLWSAPDYYLVTITDENGNALQINRWGNTRINTVVDQTGRTLQFGYDFSADSIGRLNSVADPLGRLWWMEYNSGGQLTRINWPGVNGTTPGMALSYDANANLNGIHDLNGNYSWAAGYDAGSRLTSQVDAYSNQTSYDYSSGTKVTDANDQSTTYVYQGSTLSSVTDPLNLADSYAYDANNNLTRHTDRRGKVWAFNVEAQHGNALGSVDPLGQGGSVIYDARNSKPLQETDALGNSTTLIYDAGGINLLSTTDALGHTSTINSYQWGLPTSVSDALGHTSTMSYDGDGNVVQATDANGNSSSATYNRLGWKLTSTDALGQTTGSRFDAWGRVTSVNTLPTAGVPLYKLVTTDNAHSFETASQSEYNSARQNGWVPQPPVGGLFANSTDKPGLVPLYRMRENGSGDRDYMTDINGYNTAVNSWGYVGEGIVGYVMPGPTAGFKPLYHLYIPNQRDYFTDDADEYNSLPAPWVKSGIVCYVFNNTVSTTYDNNSNVLTVTDQNGHTTTNTYDIDNRLLTTVKANGDQVTYTYDSASIPNDAANLRHGRLAAKVDGNGNNLAYGYTARGELKALYYPDGSNEHFTYDANGNLYQHVKRDTSVTTYAYDDDSRSTTTTYPAGSNTASVTEDYYANGQPWHMSDGTGTTTWTYDAANRLTQMSAPGSTVTNGYDDANRRISMTQGGHTFSYYYDNAGRMQTLDNGLGNVFDFTYDAANRLTFRNNRQAVGTAYTYNSAGLVTFILSNQNQGAGGTLNTDTYTYDPAGNRSTSDSYDGHTFYTYDAADQITGENHNTGYPSFTATYDYDHNGNRLHKTQNGQTDTYTYQPNAYNSQTHTDELLSVQGGLTGTKTFGYDQNGVARSITTNGNTLYLTADTEDRYTRFDFDTGPGAGRVNAYETYNGLGLRVFRHDAQGRNFPLAYDGASPGSALLSSAGTSFTPGLVQQDSSGQHFYQTDALGSVRGVSDNNQNPQGEVYYDAFGLPSLRQGQMPGPLGFAGAAGYQTDADTGLMLLGHRYYDSTIGRFLSPDPSGSGDNWYAYCDNNPTGGLDPEGLDCAPFTAIGMSSSEIYNHVVENGGQPGEEYTVTNVTTKAQYTFTVAGFIFNGIGVPAPHGVSIDANIMAARNFYNSNNSKTNHAIGGSGMGRTGFKPDPKKIGAWLKAHVDTGHSQDYKLKGKHLKTFDMFGHANYAALASELHINYSAILAGQQYAHQVKYGLGSLPEWSTAGESLGYGYDQAKYHPGPPIFGIVDFLP